MQLPEAAKYVVYRTPFVRRLMAPRYPYKVNPAQLTAMIELVDQTRETGAAVAEVGVAQGDTSVFLLEHLRTTRDARTLLLFDTFNGFSDESIEFETRQRGKEPAAYDAFRYGDERRFRQNLAAAGYRNFKTIAGDAARVDWTTIGQIGAMLLDIDVYQPTRLILDAVWPHVVDGGGIVIDDCLADTPWDGALQAYEEFIAEQGLPFSRVGEKGAIARKHG